VTDFKSSEFKSSSLFNLVSDSKEEKKEEAKESPFPYEVYHDGGNHFCSEDLGEKAGAVCARLG
jgi:hypothetical protein